ncbi:phosphopantothenoylcysteine decarboxylase-like protein [Coleophoma cylindrospora]|uniref:Phosphopantothenoylcysteine decarboxylase-like protein n=1 Tax=Coleophoma cylindrospora TaxID=1849047 RepID=A0A3D8QGU2_9HELO|nr:phosphopantothenoylcysteine decarboxylase-like protein [Coleophoma cylindrospora]
MVAGAIRRAEPPFVAADYANDGKHHVLLAASGSVATIKIPNIVEALSAHPNISIRLVFTKSAINFLAGQSHEQPHVDTLRSFPNVEGIYEDEDEWAHPWTRGAAILHIELRRWAHVMLIAPLSANTLAKIVGGLSDNLLTSVVRAWDTTGEVEASTEGAVTGQAQIVKPKTIMVAPAMNTAMWRHRITAKQISILEDEWGVGKDGDEPGWFEVLVPMKKELACGDVGDGAMKDWREIVQVMESRLGLST